ncbi:MAG: hypothetical protein ACK521_05950 [bacterium]
MQNLSGKVYHLETQLRKKDEQSKDTKSAQKVASPEKLDDMMVKFQESVQQ